MSRHLDAFDKARKRLREQIEGLDKGVLIAEIEQLKRRISELEDGACRFNCRKEREAFEAGYRACYEYIPVKTRDLEKMIVCRFSEWLKERDDGLRRRNQAADKRGYKDGKEREDE